MDAMIIATFRNLKLHFLRNPHISLQCSFEACKFVSEAYDWKFACQWNG